MTDEENTDEENIAELNDVMDGLTDGIQTVIDSLDNNLEYVLCVFRPEAGFMGMNTNAQPKDALDIVMRVGERMHGELNDTKTEEPKIVLPH